MLGACANGAAPEAVVGEGAPTSDSGPLGPDETFTRAFDRPGTYGYFCEIHPTMRGTVTVE